MLENVLIYISGRSRSGKHRCGFLSDSIPPCRGYFRIDQETGKSYSLREAVAILKDIILGNPGIVVIFKPI